MGLFKKPSSESDKQIWAAGVMGHHLKSRESKTIGAIGSAIGAGIAFISPPSIFASVMQTWEKAHGSNMVIKGLSIDDQAIVLSDFSSYRHLSAHKKLLEVLLGKNETAIYLVVPVYVRELVTPDLPDDYDWLEVDSAIRELAHFGSDCLLDSSVSYIENKGRYGTTEFEFVLNSLCYAGAVLRV